MDNLREAIKIVFSHVKPQFVIDQWFRYQRGENVSCRGFSTWKNDVKYLDFLDFQSAFSSRNPHYYSNDQIENVLAFLREKVIKKAGAENDAAIFELLRHVTYNEEMLEELNREPYCKYDMLLRWRDLSLHLGEDLFTTAYLAHKDTITSSDRYFFSWQSIIGTNNTRLREVLSRGIAENHFHLKGSAPFTQISWASLMNLVKGRHKDFDWFEGNNKLQTSSNYHFGGHEDTLEMMIYKAAYIRTILYEIVYFGSSSEIENQQNGRMARILKAKSLEEIAVELSDIQRRINGLKYRCTKFMDVNLEKYDYALQTNCYVDRPGESIVDEKNFFKQNKCNLIFSGEREFMYRIFKILYSGDSCKVKACAGLFYAYTLIKARFRAELVQVNDRVGFDNFSKYQDRKFTFIEGRQPYEKFAYNLAVSTTLKDQSIQSLEARIGPKWTDKEMKNTIKALDRAVLNNRFNRHDLLYKTAELSELLSSKDGKSEKVNKDRYFYVAHFIKNQEKKYRESDDIKSSIECRNYNKRKEVEAKARAIVKLKKSSSIEGSRMLGIDAASSEFGCRPEVFAQAFRYIREFDFHDKTDFFRCEKNPRMGLTFHAGEDFVELADGLRYMDEAIRFLNLSQGDRIGHGLALGTEPKKYYRDKRHNFVLTKQDLLDNIVWILGKMRKYGIIDMKVKDRLIKQYFECMNYIYEHDSELRNVSHETYYDSWKLRGDDPYLYFSENSINSGVNDFWGFCARNNSKKKVKDYIRQKDGVFIKLYRSYHFDHQVKYKGQQQTQFEVFDEYIQVISKIQKAMQVEIAHRNIGIETNPSSNFLIGTFKRYDEHPILSFNNLGLTYDQEEINKNPQLFVSINTDDQGVFSTYLENEYALMALALEKAKDENGQCKYNQTMIYDWLDRVRKMGLEQSFKNLSRF
ncbi:MAG: hypothetical protein N4A40_00740 [Tissierellales bacterium]|jgi:adenosine deaminase|nr:hypothetical protein [Tissierellales bacterium]